MELEGDRLSCHSKTIVTKEGVHLEGITYTTWREHIQQKPQWRAELAEAEKIRDAVWRDHVLEMVKSAMPRNWQAAMCYLERRYPLEFSLRIPARRAMNSIEQQREEPVPAEVLACHRALLLELARQDAAARAKRRYGLRQGQGQNR
jgi:hypothetical protein